MKMNMLEARNLIDGQWQTAHDGYWGVRHSPADGLAIGRYAASGASMQRPPFPQRGAPSNGRNGRRTRGSVSW